MKKPWWTLLFLAPFFGEVASGSTPPIKFFDVAGLFFMTLLYGSGALLIREFKVARKRSWVTIILLGCAYGILEEGLCCKSFFDPHWAGLGPLALYGRSYGVNWVWSFFLTLFHAFISIGLSIWVAEHLHPQWKDQRWLSNRGALALASALMVVTLMGFALFPDGKHPYFPSALHVLITVGIMGALVGLAAIFPYREHREDLTPAKPIWMAGIGVLLVVLFFWLMWGLPWSVFTPAQGIGLSIVLFALSIYGLVQLSKNGRWNTRSQTALVTGVLISEMLIAYVIDSRNGFTSGMVLVIVAEIALVLLLKKSLKHPSVS